MLARLARHDGAEGMPVFGSGADQDVDPWVIQDAAKILNTLHAAALDPFDSFLGGSKTRRIDVAKVTNFHVFMGRKFLSERRSTTADAHHTHHGLLIR